MKETIWQYLPERAGKTKLLLPCSIILVTLIVVLIAVTIVPALHQQPLSSALHGHPSPGKSYAQNDYGPPVYSMASVSGSRTSTIGAPPPPTPTVDYPTYDHLLDTFYAVYPQLVNRFVLDPATVATNVDLVFASNPSPLVSASDGVVVLNADWMHEHPNDVGLLTHGLTLLVEQYPAGVPVWLSDGIADYARYAYGPADDDWSLSDGVHPHDSYQQGGGIAARFLAWLEQHSRLDIIDQLNHALQKKQSFSAIFQRLTHHSVDELWKQYQARPDITLTPQQLYKTITSRKPVYQSSFHLKSDSYKLAYAKAEELSPSNFAIQVDMTIVSGDEEGEAGFFFRADSLNEDYGVYLDPNGIYYLWKLVQQSGTLSTQRLAYAPSPAIKRGLKQTNQLTIVAQQHTIYLYINSQFIAQVEDSAFRYGNLGPSALAGNQPIDVRFDNLQVF